MDVACGFVGAQSKVNRMAQKTVGGPLGEANFSDQLWPDPMRSLERPHGAAERTPIDGARGKHCGHPIQLAPVESRADVACVAQGAA
jgi:hypothetical protein